MTWRPYKWTSWSKDKTHFLELVRWYSGFSHARMSTWVQISRTHENGKHAALAPVTAVTSWEGRQRKILKKPEGMQWNNHQDTNSRQKARTASKVVLHIYICIYAPYVPKYHTSWKLISIFMCFYPQEWDRQCGCKVFSVHALFPG